jgi:hypothetical protein
VSSGFDLLGAEVLKAAPRPITWTRSAVAFAAGALGVLLVPKHPVLTFLGAAAAASNAHAVLAGERTVKEALRRMGKHVVATAGSLSIPKYPGVGYVAGAVAGDLLLDGEGGGILDEFSNYEGFRSKPRGDVIDAEFTETKTPGVQLAKVT